MDRYPHVGLVHPERPRIPGGKAIEGDAVVRAEIGGMPGGASHVEIGGAAADHEADRSHPNRNEAAVG